MSRRIALSIVALLGAGGAVFMGLSGGTRSLDGETPDVPPAAVPVVTTAGAEACRDCHPDVFATWQSSPHGRTGRPLATPAGGADLAIGSSWMQAYLRRDAAGTLRIVPQCFEIDTGTWRDIDEVMDSIQGPLMPEEHGRRPPRNTASRSFERDCSGCHVSGTHLRFDGESERVRGGWRAESIDCEACHGPARAHTEAWERMDDSEPLPDLERLDARAATAICARCHGGTPVGSGFTAEDAPHLVLRPRTAEGVFSHGAATGQIYQADAFLRSACHLEGDLTCTGCHEWHGRGLRHTEHADALCTRCHTKQADREHTHHAADNSGGRCIGCHMPRLLPGLLSHQRDHRISSPVPAALEAPDACTACHVDKDKAWAAEWAATWWGPPPADTVAAVRGIHLARSGDIGGARPYLRSAVSHEDPFFRRAAARWLVDPRPVARSTDPEGRLLALEIAARRADGEPLLRAGLNDPSPSLRALAYVLLLQRIRPPVPPPIADLETAARLSREASRVRTVLGRVYLARGRIDQAIDLLEETVLFGDRNPDAWLVLAAAYRQGGRDTATGAAVRRWSACVDPLPHLDAFVSDVLRTEEVPLVRSVLAAAAAHLPDAQRRTLAESRRQQFESIVVERTR